jgi:hypothetical protein
MHTQIIPYLAGISLVVSFTLMGFSQQTRSRQSEPELRSQVPQGPPVTPPIVPSQQPTDREESRSGAKNGTVRASLVDAEKNAKRKWATVEVKVNGVKMIDPAQAKEQPKNGQAHLHYQVDDGPVVATTSTKLSFHDLTSGKHKITVILAANDHSPLGPQDTVEVEIP